MPESRLSRAASIGVILMITTVVLIYFKELLKPLAVAFIIGYIIRALQGYIGRLKIQGKPLHRMISGTLSILLIFLALQITINLIVDNLTQMVKNYKQYEDSYEVFMVTIGDFIGVDRLGDKFIGRLEMIDIQEYLQGVISSLTAVLGNLVLIVIYIIFILLEEVTFKAKMEKLFTTSSQRERFSRISEQIFVSTNKYITLKTFVSFLTGFLSYLVLVLIGVDYAFLWAFLIFLFNYIPYIGSLIATVLPAIFALLQFGSFWPFFWVLVLVEAIQLIVGNYVEPKVIGKSLNLSPLVVVITLSFWGALWDILGMIISVPITSIMLIVLAQFPFTRSVAILLSEHGDIDDLVVKDLPPEPKA
ncbi:MAG: AI-2E family transporter [Cyclobacteriaceae bacterium]